MSYPRSCLSMHNDYIFAPCPAQQFPSTRFFHSRDVHAGKRSEDLFVVPSVEAACLASAVKYRSHTFMQVVSDPVVDFGVVAQSHD